MFDRLKSKILSFNFVQNEIRGRVGEVKAKSLADQFRYEDIIRDLEKEKSILLDKLKNLESKL